MSDFNKPDAASLYTNFLTEMHAMIDSVAKQLDGTTDSNLKEGFKRWNDSNDQWEKLNGSAAWEPLSSLYNITVLNANKLGNVDASNFVQSDNAALSNSRKCNNEFDVPATARTNLDVYSKGEADEQYLNESSNLSDGTAATMRSNLDVYSKGEADGLYLNESSNLSDGTAATMRSNLGVRTSAGTQTSALFFGWSGSVNVGFSPKAMTIKITGRYNNGSYWTSTSQSDLVLSGTTSGYFTLSGSTLSWSVEPSGFESDTGKIIWIAFE